MNQGALLYLRSEHSLDFELGALWELMPGSRVEALT